MSHEIPTITPRPEEDALIIQEQRRKRWLLIGVIVGVILFIASIAAAIFGLTRDAEVTANLRDIFIIFLAFESLIIGAALVVLIIQIASLINLMQNEVKPILQATTDTVNTLRGTTEFLSENLVDPVIKLNSYLAGFRKFFDLFGKIKK